MSELNALIMVAEGATIMGWMSALIVVSPLSAHYLSTLAFATPVTLYAP
jgi:hypothetical protein